MKTKKNGLILLLAAGMFTITSCKKEGCTDPTANNYNDKAKKDDGSCTFDAPDETFSSIAAFFDANPVTAQTFTVNSATGGSFTATGGSVITVPANAFVTTAGDPVSGSVVLSFTEILTPGDMMFSGIFPVSGGDVLNSGGEFEISASQTGNELLLADGMSINIEMPAQALDPDMMLFIQPEELVEDFENEGWGAVEDSAGGGGTWSNFTTNEVDSIYSINCDSLGSFVNIDAFDYTIVYFDCEFDLVGLSGLNNNNTKMYAAYDGQNTVWPVGGTDGYGFYGSITDSHVTESHLGGIPMTLIAISVVGGQLYYGLLDVTPVDGITYDITMNTVTSSALDAVINGL